MIGTTNATTSASGGSGGDNIIISGIFYKITPADLPNTTINLSFGGGVIATQTTESDKASKVEFFVTQKGDYTITAIRDGVVAWANTITVDNIGEFIVKSGKALTEYTKEEIHTILQGGVFSTMFSLGDKWKFVQSGSILTDLDFFVERVQAVDGKEIVDFRAVTGASSGYNIYPYYAYLPNADATAFSSTYSSNGGYKYSEMRKRMQKAGEEVYSQATGIKPDDSTIEGGIPFSQIKYTNGGTSGLYTYDRANDTFTELSNFAYLSSQREVQFVKGYFKSVGAIDEATFTAGNYYTYNSSTYVYTPATTYASGTTYYGFYETLQEDGIFVNALSSLSDYMVRWDDDFASTGMTNTTKVVQTSDFVDIPCVENITGTNRTMTLWSGRSGESINSYNIVGEGEKKPAYDDFQKQAIGYDYWTRSAYSTGSNSFCYIYYGGYIHSYIVYFTSRARVGFRLA